MNCEKSKSIKIISLFLSAVIVVTAGWILPKDIAEKFGVYNEAQAAEDEIKAINLVTPTTVNGVNNPGEGKWDYVFFGTYEGKPIKFRVLDKSTSIYGTNNSMFLDCDTVLRSIPYDENWNSWNVSYVREWLNGDEFYNNDSVFSSTERDAIVTSTLLEMPSDFSLPKTFRYGFTKITEDKIIILDVTEVNNQYGYINDKARRKEGAVNTWWLRSPHIYDTQLIANIGEQGVIGTLIYFLERGVSPALNVDLSSVLFVSAAESEKAALLSEPASSTANDTGTYDWRLTLVDSKQNISVKKGNKKDDLITIPYTYTYDSTNGTDTEASKISVMITNGAYNEQNSTIKYYGQIDDISTTGSVNIALSEIENYNSETDNIYIFSETNNGVYKTDYASMPQLVTVTESNIPILWLLIIVLVFAVGAIFKIKSRKTKKQDDNQ